MTIRLSLALAAVLLLTAPPASAVFGWVQLFRNGERVLSEARRSGLFTLDESVVLYQSLGPNPWPYHGEAWGYVDESGRVRASASTGDARNGDPLSGRSTVIWEGSFLKGSELDAPVLTLNPTDLLLWADFPPGSGPEAGSPPNSYARWEIEFSLCTEGGAGPVICQNLLDQRISLEGGENNLGRFYSVTRSQDISTVDDATGALIETQVAGGPVEGQFDWGMPGEPVLYTTTLFEQPVPLSDLLVGETYTILVSATADVFMAYPRFDGDSLAESVVADRFDILGDESGISLAPAGAGVSSPGRLCAADHDAGRFRYEPDGSVTDLYTALVWQRCPLGFAFDDGGTTDEPGDDHCQPGATGLFDWQSALVTADTDTLGGFTDWRLANAKELETLVADCIAPVIDPIPFPDAPADLFWTSTPAADGADRAWQISFLTGDLETAVKTNPARARLLRDSGDPATVAPASLTVGRAGVIEGDSGVTQLVFPVLLSQPQAAEVSLDYDVVGLSATDGVDFIGGSGTLVFPADEVLRDVAVTVTGDTLVEGGDLARESVRLELSNPTANIRLQHSTAVGFIYDDEPRLSIRPMAATEVYEGDLVQTFIIALDRPAPQAVTVDYATADDGATADLDYVGDSGSVTLLPGETEIALPVSILADDEYENEEGFRVILSNLTGDARLAASVAASVILDDDGPGTYGAVNDTGVLYCVSVEGAGAEEVCPLADYPVQDGDVGRDATQNDPADGPDGFSFTKLDSNGVPLEDQSQGYGDQPWACVQDNLSGLTWEVKNQDFPRTLHYVFWDFTWYNSSGINDGGDPGFSPPLGGDQCWDAVNCGDPTNPLSNEFCDEFQPMRCDTESFVSQVNQQGLCGFNDWRLPTAEESFTLMIMEGDTPILPSAYFVSGSLGGDYATASTDASDPSRYWVARGATRFLTRGILQSESKNSHLPVRLVRGGTRR
ncbi:MAG: DUF1566 domain-containing protein [Xanthomonadales bacterium]|nr:DUF1566 domain-containing protein [Xanthomonadales bacterium]